MNKFEAVIILEPNTEETIIHEVLKIIEDTVVSRKGNIYNTERVGVKKLAYQIKNHTSGYYLVIQFETEQDTVLELERIFRITEEIMKFLVVRKDD